MAYKLGKKAGTVQDRRTLLARDFLASTVTVPKTWRIAVPVHDWPTYMNDRYGDCTCAAMGHRIIAQEFSARQKEIRPSNQDVLAVYSGVTGFRPDQSWTDQGAYLIDVLKYMRSAGMGREKDGTAHTITAFARVNHHDHDEMRVAARMFGGLYLGLALPEEAQVEIRDEKPWRDLTGEPYSWGGHAVWMIGHDPAGVTVATWGQEQKASWAWMDEYTDEAWVVVSEDQFKSSGRTPQGLNLSAMLEEAAAL